ncbi:uncharacterized protein LOC131886720 [Tigriopus californicus]|uniref:uncharacterized protein LOC131886720 n=1 Tax=Tigriopus californicus TaxID=6832 RepID=UPI0027DA8AB4|nr:uncharacterized protein LOC131886720 [Tigriopus californicus]
MLVDMPFARAFVHDVIIFSDSLEDHTKHLDQVLQLFKNKNLRLKMSKCSFFRSCVNFLGYVVSEEGIKPNPNKLTALSDFPRPKDRKELKRFLGMCGYYRQFVKDYGLIAMPLQRQLRKSGGDFGWTQEMEKSFLTLKKKLTTAPVRVLPQEGKPFVVTCDASDVGMGATLEQGGNLVEATSHGFTETEEKWPAREKELFALIFALRADGDIVSLGAILPCELIASH